MPEAAKAADVVEVLYVSVEADVEKLLKGAAKGVDKVEKELGQVDKATDELEEEFESLKRVIARVAKDTNRSFSATAEHLRKAFQTKGVELNVDQLRRAVSELEKEAGGGLRKFNTEGLKIPAIMAGATLAIGKVIDIVGRLAKEGARLVGNMARAMVSSNTEFETASVQFETLLGSAELATARLEYLAEFGVATPFELPEITEASRVLEVFGGSVLATGENLEMIGDISAGVNVPFEQLSTTIGRLYDAMQSGRPMGMMLRRLQQIGALTGGARAELEKMSKEGRSGAEMWQFFAETVGGRFQGNMDRLSATLAGIISNLKDFGDNMLRIGGQELFEEVREAAGRFLQLLEDKKPEIERIVKGIGDIFANLVDFVSEKGLGALEDMDFSAIADLVETLWQLVEAGRTIGEAMGAWNVDISFLDQITALNDRIQIMVKNVLYFKAVLEGFAPLVQAMEAGLSQNPLKMLEAMKQATDEGVWSQERFNAAIEKADQVLAGHTERMEAHKGATDEEKEAQKERLRVLQEAAAVNKEAAAAEAAFLQRQEELADKTVELGEQLADAAEQNDTQLEALAEAHTERLEKIAEKAQLEKEKLTKAHLKRETDLRGKADEQVAKLATDTERRRTEMSRSFDLQRSREKEDHLRDMRRMELDYQEGVSDAVRSRDAGALVDLRRQHEREQTERESDFQLQQDREQQDHNLSLQELKDAEDQKRAEIQASLTKQLLAEQQSYQERMTELIAQTTREEAAENASYQKRQQSLDAALQKRLQTIAKGLADERTMDEEGARAILSSLNQTFGIGGDIDKLMEDFASRRRRKLTIRVDFEKEVVGGTTYGGTRGSADFAGDFQHGGAVIARRPTIARFGEGGPELATFTPLAQMAGMGNRPARQVLDLNLQLSGSAPPGVNEADRDAIARVLVAAIRETGALS